MYQTRTVRFTVEAINLFCFAAVGAEWTVWPTNIFKVLPRLLFIVEDWIGHVD